jgi:hypothetical protein
MAGSANVVTGSNFRVVKSPKQENGKRENFVPVTIFASARSARDAGGLSIG